MTVLSVFFVLVAVIDLALLALLRPSVISRRGRNAWVGMRTPRLMSSDEAWEQGHRIAWPWVLWGTIVALVMLVVGFVLHLRNPVSEAPILWLVLSALAQGGVLVGGAVAAERGVSRIPLRQD